MRRRSAGFTLIELLIVCGLLAVVTTMGVTAYFKMIDYWGKVQTQTQLSKQTNQALESFRKDFGSMVSSSLIQVTLTAAHQTRKDDERFPKMELVNDSVSFPIEAMTPDGHRATALVEYSVNSKNELMRTLADPLNPKDVKSRVSVASNVVQMRIEYEGADGKWADGWTQAKAPRAVRVSLNLADGVNPRREQVARKAVFTVHVD